MATLIAAGVIMFAFGYMVGTLDTLRTMNDVLRKKPHD